MAAMFLLVIMVLDTCVTAFLLARVRQLSDDVTALAKTVHDVAVAQTVDDE